MKFCLLWIITLMTVRLLPCSFQAIFIQSSTEFCGLKANCVIWASTRRACILMKTLSAMLQQRVVVKSPVNGVFHAIRLFGFREATLRSTEMKNDRWTTVISVNANVLMMIAAFSTSTRFSRRVLSFFLNRRLPLSLLSFDSQIFTFEIRPLLWEKFMKCLRAETSQPLKTCDQLLPVVKTGN